jgi:hypothetical protein
MCGKLGRVVESVANLPVKGYARSNKYVGGRDKTMNTYYNNIFTTTLARLVTKCNRAAVPSPPVHLLRDVAKRCAMLRRNVSAEGGKKRCSNVTAAILKNTLDAAGLSRTNVYIQKLMKISTKRFTRSINALEFYESRGHIKQNKTPRSDRVSVFTYRFLTQLGIDKSYVDVIANIIECADDQTEMVDYRNCQEITKVIGTMYLVMRQLCVKIPHNKIVTTCGGRSKFTYIRYVNFLDSNRRAINPHLVKHGIRPIPRSFSDPKSKKTLLPLSDDRFKSEHGFKW